MGNQHTYCLSSRRHFLGRAGAATLALLPPRSLADTMIRLSLPGGPDERPITTAFPEKGALILQRTRPPLLETPFEVFDQSVFTPNDRFFVRWHWALIPTQVEVRTFRLAMRGHVNQSLSLSLDDLMTLPRVELVAINQCSGNSRGYFQPRVTGGQWSHGAMGNARWTGVRLKDVLDRAGVKAGAVQVRFNGMDEPVVPDAPDFMKSLAVDHARDGEVMLAYAMNGAQLPLLNGFPLRLIVPGWYSTYWVKMLNDIEVLDRPDTNFWTATAYTIPDTPHASVRPGDTGYKSVPISRMVPRSFITNIKSDDTVRAGVPTLARGIAFGGDTGVARVDFSSDGGKTWQPAELGKDEGKYSFRQWQARFVVSTKGPQMLMVRCTSSGGERQPDTPNWNPSGFMLNAVEQTPARGGGLRRTRCCAQRSPLPSSPSRWCRPAQAVTKSCYCNLCTSNCHSATACLTGRVRMRSTTIVWPAIPPEWCSISRRCRRRNGGRRSIRCARPTRHRSIPRTSVQSLVTSLASRSRNNKLCHRHTLV
jgi:DMSO/TMAO reductase YedYZ molybdopterin-dependent catalytic subunit